MTPKKKRRDTLQVTDTELDDTGVEPTSPEQSSPEANVASPATAFRSDTTAGLPKVRSKTAIPVENTPAPVVGKTPVPAEEGSDTLVQVPAASQNPETTGSPEKNFRQASRAGETVETKGDPLRKDESKTSELENRRFNSYTPPPTGPRPQRRRSNEPSPSEGEERSALRSEARKPRPVQREGDTVQIRVAGAPAQQKPRMLRPRPRGPVRATETPKAATPRFGFWSFIFGFAGLIFRMIVVTLLVFGIVGFLSYEAVRMYVDTSPVIVPDVRGIPTSEALARLSEKKLGIVNDKTEASALVAPGEIINQEPQAGTKTKVGSIVRVTTSKGRANFTVPNVVNESRENAETRIKGAGLVVGNITYIEDDKIPRDTIINQNPDAGKGLDQATKVDLLISSGSKGSTFTMPDLTGRPANEAKAILARLGVIDVQTDPPGAVNQPVLAQEPLVGKLIVQSQTVKLTTQRK